MVSYGELSVPEILHFQMIFADNKCMKRIISSIVMGLIVCALCAAQVSENGSFIQEGIASWYGAEFEGRPTASGEIFRVSQLTAAHPSLPFGTLLRVINKNNNRSVVVRVNDRGPFVTERIIDLSKAAAEQIDMIRTGTAPVFVERVEFAAASTDPAPVQPQTPGITQTPQGMSDEQPAAPVYYLDVPPAAEDHSATAAAPAAPAPTTAPAAVTHSSQPSGYTAPPSARAAVVKGSIPGENSAKLYRIQVGSYAQPRNAVEAFEKLKNAGLNPAYEKYQDYYRVVLSGIRNTDVKSVAEKLGQAGFMEALVKEEN
jgi:rare lipoprotein A